MKLIVQVPCFNEEKTLPLVLNSIPKEIPGVDEVETLIVDDGSTDKTVDVARKLGVNHIVKHKQNRGLAQSFSDGINEALRQGADIIVNTDGDNQYPQQKIPDLIQPILNGTHEIVVADRQTDKIKHFSPLKKWFQKLGSRVVNWASGTNIPDAPSGFRAYSRDAAMSLNVTTAFSYCMETIIHAGRKRIPITHVPVTTNPKTRESRLFKNIFEHMHKSAAAILRGYAMHQPFKIFLTTGIIVTLIGLIPYAYFTAQMLLTGEKLAGHLQSLIFGAVFIIMGLMMVVMGVIADLLAVNRKLIEDALYRMKKMEYNHFEKTKQTLEKIDEEIEETKYYSPFSRTYQR